MKDYHAVIDVEADVKSARHAIHKEMHIWWSNRVELFQGGATIRFNKSFVTFDFEPPKDEHQFIWNCREAKMIIEGVDDEAEWEGTKLLWQLDEREGGTHISLTHQGLNTDLECRDICVAGWVRFFENSLKNHLNGKAASPEIS